MIKFLTVAASVAAVFAAVGPVMAHDNYGARLRGFEEVPAISTHASGFVHVAEDDSGTRLDYQLIYVDMESPVTQAHIHIGQQSVNGGIVLYLCSNLPAPANVPLPPACPNGPGFQSVTGSLTAANVVAQTGQGISAGDFHEVHKAIEAGIAYANVHTLAFSGGEIRGQLSR